MAQNCSNCYNGCSEVISDQCVKYTGIDVPLLGIVKGDSLSYVEQALITFLTSTINGSGIKITLDEDDYCELVSQYLQECQEVTALDLFKALVKAACDLQEQVDVLDSRIDTIEANYTIGCLTGVSANSGTHAILQAVITKLCAINTTLTALALDVDTNYVKIADINGYIAAYLATQTTATRYYTRMVPFTIVAYYGSLSFFSATGAGLPNTEWEKIYLCNGNNGTPDIRGRAIVGTIAGVPGGALDTAVNPASSAFNTNYALGTKVGVNFITLDTTQIPSHTHVATSTGTITPNPHTHTITGTAEDTGGFGAVPGAAPGATESAGSTNSTNLSVSVSTSLTSVGGGLPHANNQPVIATHYIMYIP